MPDLCPSTADVDQERVYAAAVLRRHGYQSQSYNILRQDKSYFLSTRGVEGVIAYVVHTGVVLGAGDPLCDPRDLCALTEEFREFCRKNHKRCCFQAITDRFAPVAKELGFGTIQIGEEPIFDLRVHSWAGGKLKDLRRDVRRAKALGLQVVEYKPLEGRRPDWEYQMDDLSRAWLKFKGSGEFSFLIGQPQLDQPGDRKFFLALKDEQVEAFVVCLPIYARNGFYFDLMRRKQKPLPGTSELLIYEAFGLLRGQGYLMATLGAAPLSHQHVHDPHQQRFLEIAMDLGLGHLGAFRRHKQLYEFKTQFGATSWEARYLAFWPPRFNPVILYALLKAYDPSAISGRLRRELGLAWRGVKLAATVPQELIGKVVGDRQNTENSAKKKR